MPDALQALARNFGDLLLQLQGRREGDAVTAAFERIRMANAGNLAEKHALRRALATLDPEHPLLTDSVREQVLQAGRDAYQHSGDWQAVRQAGENFGYAQQGAAAPSIVSQSK